MGTSRKDFSPKINQTCMSARLSDLKHGRAPTALLNVVCCSRMCPGENELIRTTTKISLRFVSMMRGVASPGVK